MGHANLALSKFDAALQVLRKGLELNWRKELYNITAEIFTMTFVRGVKCLRLNALMLVRVLALPIKQ